MTRSILQPIRTRRVATGGQLLRETAGDVAALTPGTRKTLAAIGALWVSFAVTSSGKSAPSRGPVKRGDGVGDETAAPLQSAGMTSQ
jgi:hypothetical protein